MEENKDHKKIAMKIGVISIMILIVIFWVLNLKNSFSIQESAKSQNREELQVMEEELSNAINKMNDGLDKIKATDDRLKEASSSLLNEFVKKTNDMVVSSSSVPNSVSDGGLDSLPPAPGVSSTTAPEKISPNCPSYINCMPTTGETRACQIPVGCEGITQIAY